MSLLRAFKNTCFQNLVASKNYCRSNWKAIYTLTNKAASIPQVTVKKIPQDKLNSHSQMYLTRLLPMINLD